MVRRYIAAAVSVVLVMVSSGLPAMADSIAMPEIHEFTLSTGQKLYIKEDHDQPIVTIDTWVKTGSVNETKDNNGVSHFLEHLLFKGTSTHPVGEIERLLESKGAVFNAATSTDFTHYYITTASPFAKEALNLHADMLLNATIPQDELDRERKVVQEEINRAMDNPQRQMYNELTTALFGSHGYSLETLGPKETIEEISRESIMNYYHYWYQPKNFSTVIVGDVNPEEIRKLVEAEFPAPNYVKPEDYNPPYVSKPALPDSVRVKVLKDANVTQAYAIFGFPGPSIETPNDVYALDIGMMTLGMGKSSRLYRTLREQKALVNTIGGGNYTKQYSGIVYVSADLKPENLETVKPEIIAHIEKIKKEGITPEELDKAKTQYLKDFVFEDETTDGAAGHIGYNVTIGSLKDYTDHVNHIQKVSQADVKAALNQYLDFNRAVWVATLPEKLSDGSKADTKQQEKSMRALLATATENQALLANTPADPKSAYVAPQVTALDLDNGMRVLLKPLRDSATVAIKIFIKGGQSVEPLPGVATLTGSLLLQGTQTRNAEAISKELESRGMALDVSVSEDFVEITGSAVRDDLGELFLILGDVLSNPAFEESELVKKKDLIRESIKASRENPSSVAFETLTLSMYPDHPYGNVGKRIEASLDEIDREALKAYYQRYLKPENMVVSVVGNFDPDAVKNYLLNAVPGKQKTPVAVSTEVTQKAPQVVIAPPVVPPLKENVVVTENKEKQAATWVAKGWLVPSISSKDYVSLKVLNALLGTGMSSRMFSNIREKRGLAYVVGSIYPSRQADSRFVMYIGTDPKNGEAVQEAFVQETDRLKTELVDETELKEARDKLAGNFALSHETNVNQAYYLGFFEVLGVGYEYDESYSKLIQEVTPEDIQHVAQQYFSKPNVTVVVSPASGNSKAGK